MSALAEEELSLDESLTKLGSHRSTREEISILYLLHFPSPPAVIFVASNAIVPGLVTSATACDAEGHVSFDDADFVKDNQPSTRLQRSTSSVTNYIGHYNPAGNYFFAFAVKDILLEWVGPKPPNYGEGAIVTDTRAQQHAAYTQGTSPQQDRRGGTT